MALSIGMPLRQQRSQTPPQMPAIALLKQVPLSLWAYRIVAASGNSMRLTTQALMQISRSLLPSSQLQVD